MYFSTKCWLNFFLFFRIELAHSMNDNYYYYYFCYTLLHLAVSLFVIRNSYLSGNHFLFFFLLFFMFVFLSFNNESAMNHFYYSIPTSDLHINWIIFFFIFCCCGCCCLFLLLLLVSIDIIGLPLPPPLPQNNTQ